MWLTRVIEEEGGKDVIATESLDQMMIGIGSPTAEQSRVVLARGKSVSKPTGADRNTGGESTYVTRQYVLKFKTLLKYPTYEYD